MAVHNGVALCMNCLCWGSNPTATREEEHKGIVEAFQSAKASGAQPTTILLQDYEWGSNPGLEQLVQQLNAASGSSWSTVRQWGGEEEGLTEEGFRDAVVIYDSAIYAGGDFDKESISSFRDRDDLLAGMQEDIKAQLSGFNGRWAGVQLVVKDASGAPSALEFLAVSYHGKKMVKGNNEYYPVQTSVKTAMSKDFVNQVADVGASKGDPALIAGCFNVDSAPLSSEGGLHSDETATVAWVSTVHVTEGVDKDPLGMPIDKLDYALTINHTPETADKAHLKVTEVRSNPHSKELASHFHHVPFIVKFTLNP